MNDPKRRFLRIYFDDLERDYPDVWFDPTCLSTYTRLLSLAEKAWPSAPELPKAVRRADLALLQKPKVPGEDALVTLLEHGRFAMKGWQAERSGRAKTAKDNADKRWHGYADAMQPHSNGNAHVSNPRASSSSSVVAPVGGGPEGDPAVISADDLPAVIRWLAERRIAVIEGTRPHTDLARLVDQHGGPAVVEAMAGLPGPLHDGPQYVYGARNELNPIPSRQGTAKAKGYGPAKEEVARAFRTA